jgi:hypothetical protein
MHKPLIMKRYIFVNPFLKHPILDARVVETTKDYTEIECPMGYALFTITKI